MSEVSVDEAAALVDAGAALLDVREPDEWAAGHVDGALFMPMGDVEARWRELPEDEQVVVICRGGHRSAGVTDALRSAGIDAVNLSGGITAWVASGRPITTDAGQPGSVI